MLQRNDSDRVMWVAGTSLVVGPGDTFDLDLPVPGCNPADGAESASPALAAPATPEPAPEADSPPPADPAPSAAEETPPADSPETSQPDEAGQPETETAP